MTIDAGIAFRMGDIDGIAKAADTNGQSAHIAVAYRIDMLAFHIIGLDVQAAVKVIGTWLTKITRQCDFVIHWRVISHIGFGRSAKSQKPKANS